MIPGGVLAPGTDELERRYEAADGCIAAVAQHYEADYRTVRHWLIRAGVHEPRSDGRAERLADQLADTDWDDLVGGDD
ncbi:hypothetical protein [Haloarchaeobius sp. DFWS5]|uniref:hypothetical protein n=1 Tax=Haloarchaeobius sp. DFWS5 TaxID=3446114 RepID=UPI003EB9BE5C